MKTRFRSVLLPGRLSPTTSAISNSKRSKLLSKRSKTHKVLLPLTVNKFFKIDSSRDLEELLESQITYECTFTPDKNILAKTSDIVKHMKGLVKIGESNFVGVFHPQTADSTPVAVHIQNLDSEVACYIKEFKPSTWGRQLGLWFQWIFSKH